MRETMSQLLGSCCARAGGRVAVVAVLTLAGMLAPMQAATAATSTLYVGGAGWSPSGPGTQAQPFCTISQAAAVAGAGQTVLVSSGTYTENVPPTNSRPSRNPIPFPA